MEVKVYSFPTLNFKSSHNYSFFNPMFTKWYFELKDYLRIWKLFLIYCILLRLRFCAGTRVRLSRLYGSFRCFRFLFLLLLFWRWHLKIDTKQLKSFFFKASQKFMYAFGSCLYNQNRALILTLLELKDWLAFVTSIEPGQHAHPCNLTRLYTDGWLTSNSHLEIPKTL